MNAPVELSVVIVNWHTYGLVAECVASLRETVRGCRYEVLVVDNSQDGAGREAWRAAGLDGVRWIHNDVNRGFAASNNQALREAAGQAILLLNPDTVALAGTVDAMLACLRRDGRLGIVGCDLLNTDGTPQTSAYRTFPSLAAAALDVSGLPRAWRALAPRLRRRRNGLREVAWVKGACLMVRAATARRIGPMDEGFFLYAEDADWCRRARDAGWRVAVLRGRHVVHHGQRSAARDRRASVAAYYDAYLRFVRKHDGPGVLGLRARACALLLRLAACGRMLALAAAGAVRPPHRDAARAYLGYLLETGRRRGG